MHIFVDQKRYRDDKFSKKLNSFLLASAIAGSKERFAKRKRELGRISKIFQYYYSSILFDCRAISKCLDDLSGNEKNGEVDKNIRQINNSLMVLKIKLDYLVREGKEIYFMGEVDRNVHLAYFLSNKKILVKPKYFFKKRNFKNCIQFLRKKGIEKDLPIEIAEALRELDEFSNVYIRSYEAFKTKKSLPESNLMFRELNWAAYCLVGFSFRWRNPFASICYFGLKPVV
jgi:hypothetical protein